MRLNEAAQCRLSLGIRTEGYTDTFRLVHGEGDQLPGLIIDVYGPVAVVQAHSIGMYKALPDDRKSPDEDSSIPIQSVYSKSKDSLPSNFAHRITDAWVQGQPPAN